MVSSTFTMLYDCYQHPSPELFVLLYPLNSNSHSLLPFPAPGCCHLLLPLWICGEGNSTPLQYPCLENPMDGGPGGLQSMGLLRVGHDWLHFHFSLSCIGEGNGNPLQCSCLENPRDRGAWWAAVYWVAQSRTRLKWLSRCINMQMRTESPLGLKRFYQKAAGLV